MPNINCRLLGEGQSGVVHLADLKGVGTKSGRRVAVKMARTSAAPRALAVNELRERAVVDEALLVEAFLLRGLQHPAIVVVVALVTEGVPVLLCMELMPNGTLKDFLRKCR